MFWSFKVAKKRRQERARHGSAGGRKWPEVKGVFIADTPERCREALKWFKNQPAVGVDTEFYGVDLKKEHPKGKAKAVSIQFAGRSGPRVFVPLWTGSGEDVDPQGNIALLEEFRDWLEDERPQKVGTNLKADMHVLANYGIRLRGIRGDTMISDYLWANGAERHALKETVRRYSRKVPDLVAPYTEDDADDYADVFREPKPLKRKGKNGETLYGKQKWVPPLCDIIKRADGIEKLIRYSVKDPYFSVCVEDYLKSKLEKVKWTKRGSYYDYYQTFEIPYIEVLFDIEREGCPVDIGHLKTIEPQIAADMERLAKTFMRMVVKAGVPPSFITGEERGKKPKPFSFKSGPMISELFYEILGQRVKVVTKKGAPSTSAGTLRKFKGKVVKKLVNTILEWRKLDKLLGTYVRPWIAKSHEYGGRIHTTLKQTGTATMRLSSSAFNLQNVTKKGEKDPYGLRMAFIAPLGYELGDIDLDQIEVRLTAHVTGDQALLDVLNNDYDQHVTTMIKAFPNVSGQDGRTVAEVANGRPASKEVKAEIKEALGADLFDDLRRLCKVVNFGIIYGMGPQGYARQTDRSEKEGERIIKGFFQAYPGVAKGIKRVRQECYQKGHVRTLLRRYCVIRGIRSDIPKIRGAAERQAFNYVIQGSAADMLKMAMLLIHRDKTLRKLGVKMILQIHDELLIIIPKKAVAKAKPIIDEYVSHPYRHFGMNDLIIDTPASLGVAANWQLAKDAA